MLSVDPRVHGYTPERTTQFLEQLRQRVAAIPGVVSVAATDSAPLSGGNRSDGFRAEAESKSTGPDPFVELYMATPGYFETMGIPRLAGRDFAHEAANAPKVAIVNRAFAEHFFPGRIPSASASSEQASPTRSSASSKTSSRAPSARILDTSSSDRLHRASAADPSFLGYELVVHFRGNSAAVAGAVRGQIHDLDSTMAVYNIRNHGGASAPGALSAPPRGHALRHLRTSSDWCWRLSAFTAS